MKSIDKHEHFLLFISNIVKFFGLLILSATVVMIILLFVLDLSTAKHADWFFKFGKYLPKIIPGAFLLLGMDQFIKYLLKKDSKPNWFILHVDILIYMYVIFLFVSFFCVYISYFNHPRPQDTLHIFFRSLIFFLFPAISIFVRILFWIALGLVLRRLVPIIKEIKSLV